MPSYDNIETDEGGTLKIIYDFLQNIAAAHAKNPSPTKLNWTEVARSASHCRNMQRKLCVSHACDRWKHWHKTCLHPFWRWEVLPLKTDGGCTAGFGGFCSSVGLNHQAVGSFTCRSCVGFAAWRLDVKTQRKLIPRDLGNEQGRGIMDRWNPVLSLRAMRIRQD